MKLWTKKHLSMGSLYKVALVIAISCIVFVSLGSISQAQDKNKKLITVYDRDTQSVFLTDQKTIGAALKDEGIELDPRDTVEPSRDEELVAADYQVNIYRARPVFVSDGATRVKIMSPYQVADQIAKHAGITVYPEDNTSLAPLTDFIGDGAGLQLHIDRATSVMLDLYTKKTQIRTQGKTVAEMLKEKGIVLAENDRVSVNVSTPITEGMEIRVWREGKQTVSVDEAVLFDIERIFDADRLIGYKEVKTVGIEGSKTITYEIEVNTGVEVSRKEIASIVVIQPSKQVEVIGIKPNPNALTKSKGAHVFVDSKGVSHRETYYDLPMGIVMHACGQGGKYTIRPGDGAKVDSDGYVIIAANYGNYPRCSVVETSMGLGRVYDTGGFAARHPHGFDLATDWTNNNGN